jgi:hypothetical protein
LWFEAAVADSLAFAFEMTGLRRMKQLKRRTFCRTAVAAALTAELTAKQAAETPAMAVVEKKAGKVAFYSSSGIRLSEVRVGIFPHEMAW